MSETLYDIFATVFQWGCFLIIVCGILFAYVFAFVLYCIMVIVYMLKHEIVPVTLRDYFSPLGDALAIMRELFL